MLKTSLLRDTFFFTQNVIKGQKGVWPSIFFCVNCSKSFIVRLTHWSYFSLMLYPLYIIEWSFEAKHTKANFQPCQCWLKFHSHNTQFISLISRTAARMELERNPNTVIDAVHSHQQLRQRQYWPMLRAHLCRCDTIQLGETLQTITWWRCGRGGFHNMADNNEFLLSANQLVIQNIISEYQCQKQISRAWISNYIPQCSVRCYHLFMQ